MPSAARKSLMGGYTSWSDPRTWTPLCLSMAASVAIAVPQTPMRCTRLLNGGLFDDESRPGIRDNTARNTERQRHCGASRVTRRESDEHRPWEIAEQIRDNRATRQPASVLVAPRQLTHNHGNGTREHA